jgi:hypothetical protein
LSSFVVDRGCPGLFVFNNQGFHRRMGIFRSIESHGSFSRVFLFLCDPRGISQLRDSELKPCARRTKLSSNLLSQVATGPSMDIGEKILMSWYSEHVVTTAFYNADGSALQSHRYITRTCEPLIFLNFQGLLEPLLLQKYLQIHL